MIDAGNVHSHMDQSNSEKNSRIRKRKKCTLTHEKSQRSMGKGDQSIKPCRPKKSPTDVGKGTPNRNVPIQWEKEKTELERRGEKGLLAALGILADRMHASSRHERYNAHSPKDQSKSENGI